MAIQYCDYDIKGTLAVTGTSTLTGAVTITAATSSLLSIQNTTNGGSAAIRFIDTSSGTQPGDLIYKHSDSQSQGGGASWHFVAENPTHLVVGSSSIVGRVVVKSGSSATKCDYAFFDDVNTGMVRTSADNVSLVAGGIIGVGVGAAAVSLKYAGATKLATSSGGVEVSGGITTSAAININNPASDKKISFDRTGGKSMSIEHDASSMYFYNETDAVTMFKMFNAGSATVTGDFTVNGGDITLGGTGRIQGVDTVSASTDAANKAYVDAHDGGAGVYLPLAGGTMTGTSGVIFPDNFKAKFGTGSDVSIDFDGTNGQILQAAGDLYITNSANDKDIIFQSDDGSGGTATYLRLDGGSVTNQFLKTVKLYDNVALWLGDNNDLQIYHDGNDSYISDTGTGILFIRASSALRVQGANGESMIDANENGAVTLYYDNSAKLDTTSFGVNVTGQVTAGADKATPEYSFKGDQDTGVNQPGGVANQVGFMNDGKDTLTMLATGQEILNQYTASAVTTTNALNPNQNFQAASQDTLATLAVDVNGYVVRGSQEGTWTFTKAQLDALTTSTTSGTTLISAPGATKAIIVEESNLMIKYSGTGTMSSNSFVIRQAHNGDSSAEVTRLPSGQINTIMSSAPANPSYGFYSRDLPLYNNDGRSFVTNKATFLSRINTNATPSNLTSITIKLKYRLFDVSTF